MKNEELTGNKHLLTKNKGFKPLVTQMITDYFCKGVIQKR